MMSGNRNGTPGTSRVLVGLLMLALLGAGGGCLPLPNSGPTAVSQRERYEPGVPEYDAFFARFHQLQLTVVAAPGERDGVRRALAAELGLEPNASAELVAARLEKRAEELRANGTVVRIDFIGMEEGAKESDVVVSVTDASGKDVAGSFPDTLREVAKRAQRLHLVLRAAERDAKKLGAEIPALDADVDAKFRLLGPLRAKEAHRNLADATLELPSLQQAVRTNHEESNALLELLQQISAEDREKKQGSGANTASKPGASKPKGKAPDYEP